jgi:hypothetical protein
MAGMGQRKNESGDWALLAWRRHGGSTAGWPSPWEGPVEHLPEPPDRWVPDHAGAAVVMCVHCGGGHPSVIIDWGTPEDAELLTCRLVRSSPSVATCWAVTSGFVA